MVGLKGQLISKIIYGLLTFPKQLTDLFTFLLKWQSHFLGESTTRQSAFRFNLTFSIIHDYSWFSISHFALRHVRSFDSYNQGRTKWRDCRLAIYVTYPYVMQRGLNKWSNNSEQKLGFLSKVKI